MEIKFYYSYEPIDIESIDRYEKIENINLPKEYKNFLTQNDGGILCKNKYHFLDLYGKNYNLKIRLLYPLRLVHKQIVDGEYDNYLYIGEAFSDYNNFISNDYITLNLINGNICAYDDSYNHIMAKSFNSFLSNIKYDDN